MKGLKKIWEEYGDEALMILAIIVGVFIATKII